MAGRMLGDAFITLYPETRNFRILADTQLRKAIAGISPQVRLGADTSRATTAITNFQVRLRALNDVLGKMRADVDTKGAAAKVVGLQARVLALAKSISSMTMRADTGKLDAQIAAEGAKLKGLQQQISNLQADADTKAAAAKIAALEKQAFHLQEDLDEGNLTADVDITDARAKLASIAAQLKVLKDNTRAMKLAADNSAILRQIDAVTARIAGLRTEAKDIRLGTDIDPAKLLAAEAALLGIEHAAEGLAPAAKTGDVALDVLGKAIIGNGNGWGFLTRSIVLFGGTLNRVLPVVASSVAIWHVLADAIIEFAAVWIPAGLAVGAFAVAASDAAVEVQRRMQAMHTELDATGRSIPGLTSGMEALHDAVRPQVYQLFGDAMTVMRSRTGTFAQVAKQTGTVIDQLAARMTYAITSSNKLGTSTTQLSAFWKTAITDVSKLGDSIGNLFGIFGNLFRAIPGFAAGLLTIGDDFTKILESASAAAVPVLKWVLLLHGYILYTGLAVTGTLAFVGAMANLARQFVTFAAGSVLAGVGALKNFGSLLVTGALKVASWGEEIVKAEGAAAKFGAALAPLSANPMFWVAAAAVALGALVFEIIRSKDAAQQFNDTMQQTIANAQLSNVITTIQNAQAATAARLAASTTKLNEAIKTNTAVNAGRAGALNSNGTAIQNLDNSTRNYQAGLSQLDTQQKLVASRFSELTGKYGSSTAALGLLNAAGITGAQITSTQGHAWAEALIQIDSTVQAYQTMGTQAGTLGNDLDVLGRTVTDQYQAVQKLNQGWSSFISDVTSTQGSFDTVAEGFSTLSDHTGKLTFTLGKLKASYADNAALIKGQAGLASASAAVATAQNRLNKLQSSGSATSLQLQAAQQRLSAAQDRLTVAQLGLASAQNQGRAAIDALTPAGIALNQAFTDQITNIDKLFASWRTAGLANNLFTSGVKLAIAPLTKYAAGSQEATAQLVALAEEAGYQGPVSMQALTKWLGNTHNATQKLKDITNQATTQEALLTGAMQNQGSFIAGQLLSDINDSILAYNGVKTAAANYGKAIAQFGKDSTQAHAAQQALIADIVKSGGAAGGTAKQIAALISKITGIPQSQALKDVYADLGQVSGAAVKADPVLRKVAADFTGQGKAAKGARDQLDDYNGKIVANGINSDAAQKSRKQLIQDLIDAGVKSKTANKDVGDYTTAIQQNGALSDQAEKARRKLVQDILDADTNANTGRRDLDDYTKAVQQNGSQSDQAKSARSRLIADLENSGLNAKTARGLVDGLQTSIDKMHGKTVGVSVHTGGSGGISSTVHLTGQGTAAGQGNLRFMPAAAGWFVSTGSGPTADDVPAMLSRGEYVIKASSVSKYGKAVMDQINAGAFGSGGLVRRLASGGIADPAGALARLESFPVTAGSQFGAQAGADFLAQSEKYFEAAARAAQKTQQGISQAVGNVGSGVARWAGLVTQALTMEGLSPALLHNVLFQMQSESGGNPNAINLTDTNAAAGDPSRGLMQTIMSTFLAYHWPGTSFNIYDPLANITAALNYARHRYGPSLMSGGMGIGSGHGYALGGLIQGLASGGSVSAFHSRLTSAQNREYHDYLGYRKAMQTSLHAARPGSYLSGHKASITGELATLAKKQSAEEAAYDAVFHKGATRAVMAHLNTTLRSVMTTTHDKGLSYSGPGGHPGWLHGLQAQLSGLEHIATGPVPAGAATAPRGPKLTQAAFMTRLKSLQSAEYRDYLGLAAAFKAGLRHPAKGSWLYRNRGLLAKDLTRLRGLQSAEEAGYDNILHHGTSLDNLSKEAGRISTELGALKAGELSHLPGGHPGWVKGLSGQLTSLGKLLAVQPYNAPWAPSNLGPVHTAAPGVETFDTGRGVLLPGMNLAWNGTGRDEALSSNRAGHGGDVHLHLAVNGPVGSQAELEGWFVRMANHTARTGKLTQAVRTAGR
jgi:hypothetical protein